MCGLGGLNSDDTLLKVVKFKYKNRFEELTGEEIIRFTRPKGTSVVGCSFTAIHKWPSLKEARSYARGVHENYRNGATYIVKAKDLLWTCAISGQTFCTELDTVNVSSASLGHVALRMRNATIDRLVYYGTSDVENQILKNCANDLKARFVLDDPFQV